MAHSCCGGESVRAKGHLHMLPNGRLLTTNVEKSVLLQLLMSEETCA